MTTRIDRLIPAGLIALSLVPMAAGITRLAQLGAGADITADNARFFAAPGPVVVHIGAAVIYSVLGAFQFAPEFRRRRPGWHRAAGRILIPCGFLAALSGLWMTQFYRIGNPGGALPADFEGPVLYWIRLLAGSAMILFLVLGVNAIRSRDFTSHGAWMMRAYALGLGAGTQVFTHLPWFLFPVIHGEPARTLCMAAGWVINAAVAEWVIARGARRPLSRVT
jgi:uncharacterized membrane protein